MWQYRCTDELYHHGTKGQKWGVRRYQNEDGSLTAKGRARYQKLRDRSAYNKTSADSYSYRAAKARRRGKTEKADRLDVKARKLYKKSTRDEHKADRLSDGKTRVAIKMHKEALSRSKSNLKYHKHYYKLRKKELDDLETKGIDSNTFKKETERSRKLVEEKGMILKETAVEHEKHLKQLKKVKRYSIDEHKEYIKEYTEAIKEIKNTDPLDYYEKYKH